VEAVLHVQLRPEEQASREDRRSFEDLSTVWASLSGLKPELLLEALVQSFWRGEFEKDVRLVKSQHGDVYEGQTAITTEAMPESHSPDGAEGNYAFRHDGIIVKVGSDGISRPTADRTEINVYRDSVARGVDIPEWDGCTKPGAGQKLIPQEVFRDFAAYDFNQWSKTTVNYRFKRWRIGREKFAEWYSCWKYAPLLTLVQMWPQAGPLTSYREGGQKKKKMPPMPTRPGPRQAAWKVLNEKYPDGIPDDIPGTKLRRIVNQRINDPGRRDMLEGRIKPEISLESVLRAAGRRK
jgi:hypothetical protein